MLNKLLKYELKATARILLPLYLVLLAYSAIHKLISVISPSRWQAPEVISFIVYIMLLVGLFVMTLIIIIQRFYKNLLTDEGYLMFTLPAETWKHIVCKLLVSMLWSAASGIAGIISILVIAFEKILTANNFAMISFFLKDYFAMFKVNGALFIFEVIIISVISLASSVLLIYASVALGHLFNKHRILASLGAFMVLNTLSQIILTILSAIPTRLSASLDIFGSRMQIHANSLKELLQYTGLFHTFMWTFIAIMAVLTAGYFFVTNYILSKRLNLE